jgi:hypothetical protein
MEMDFKSEGLDRIHKKWSGFGFHDGLPKDISNDDKISFSMLLENSANIMINDTDNNYKRIEVMFVVLYIELYTIGVVLPKSIADIKTLLIKFNKFASHDIFNQDINGIDMDRAIIDYFIDEIYPTTNI